MAKGELSPPATQLTERDKVCLNWIALQYAIRFDQLRRLLYRTTPEQDRYKLRQDTDAVSVDRAYEFIRKWLEHGLVEKKIILHSDQLWIWLSRAGLRYLELTYHYNGAPASDYLKHYYYINQVRLAIETKRPDDLWKSERQIRKELPPMVSNGERKPHAPDGILTNTETGRVTAIEVEVHEKTGDELDDDLRELAISYKSVWYFTTSGTRRQIEAKLQTFPPEMQKPFVLYNLKEYGNEYGLL